jgi:hypothetical protein
MFYNLIKKYFGDSTNVFHQFELIELKLLMNKIGVHNVTLPDKNVLRLPITLLIFIIMLLNLDAIISKI